MSHPSENQHVLRINWERVYQNTDTSGTTHPQTHESQYWITLYILFHCQRENFKNAKVLRSSVGNLRTCTNYTFPRLIITIITCFNYHPIRNSLKNQQEIVLILTLWNIFKNNSGDNADISVWLINIMDTRGKFREAGKINLPSSGKRPRLESKTGYTTGSQSAVNPN